MPKLNKWECMVDIESLDTAPSSVVISLGAICFSTESYDLGPDFHALIDPRDQQARGRTLSAATVIWWMRQSEEARKPFFVNPESPEEVLNLFIDFIKGEGVDGVWGNGSDFDNVILRSLYDTYEIKCPWSHTKNRCYRTLKNLVQIDPPPRSGVHHNARDDAEHQAQHAQMIFAKLRGS